MQYLLATYRHSSVRVSLNKHIREIVVVFSLALLTFLSVRLLAVTLLRSHRQTDRQTDGESK